MAKTFNIWKYQITQGLKVESIEVSKMPDKLNYYVGDSFDSTGMEITATFDNGITGFITGYTWTPNIISKDTNNITISYSNGSLVVATTIEIIIEDKPIEIPYTNSSFTYNGDPHIPVWHNYNSEAMEISGPTFAIDAGTYTTTFTLKEGYKWTDGSKESISIEWTIEKAETILSLSASEITLDEVISSATVTVSSNSDGVISAYAGASMSLINVSVEGNEITIYKNTSDRASTYVGVECNETTNYKYAKVFIYVTIKVWKQKASYTTAGTYSYTPTTSAVSLILVGGGGGGGSGASGNIYVGNPGAGGGGGGGRGKLIALYDIPVTPEKAYTLVVGAGGAGGAANDTVTGIGNDGTAGGSSSAFDHIALGGDKGEGGVGAEAGQGAGGAGGNGAEGGDYEHINGYNGSSGEKTKCEFLAYEFDIIDGAGGGGGCAGYSTGSENIFGSKGIGAKATLDDDSGKGGDGGGEFLTPATKGNDGNGFGCGGGGGGGGGGRYGHWAGGSGGNGQDGAIIIFEKG